ncbi:hypothetical protein DPMN_082189 [Dreissena polymorpha]|uniref:Uncharacterized protein n=1 Tax=Dreissena polymorpha TaxID=45954 RepID=A0A9D4BIJ9_DREPO|nr:hypothetical protein DPMN_082189 [Dreissena polymorpha]
MSSPILDDKSARELHWLVYAKRLRQDVIKKVFSNNSDFRSSSGQCFACRITGHVVVRIKQHIQNHQQNHTAGAHCLLEIKCS